MGAVTVSACADRELHSIVMALDATGDRPRSEFYTDTTSIFCVADYASTRKDITINAIIRKVLDENNNPADEILAVGEIAPGISHGQLSFELHHPEPPPGSMASGTLPFPVGTFRCELYVDGLEPGGAENVKPSPKGQNRAPQQQIEFKIKYPSCPVAFPQTNVVCGGYYRTGQQCRGANNKTTCTCDGTVWQCGPT